MTSFTSFLLKAAPTLAAATGLIMLVLGGLDRRGDHLVAGSILVSSAMIASQLAYTSKLYEE